MNKKIISVSRLKKICKGLKRHGKKIVFSNGCFDLLHRGHIEYLKNARAAGDRLVIGLNSDSSVRRLKGPGRPVTSERDRAEILASLEFVDFVIIFKDTTPINLIRALRPDILIKGADWKKENIVGADFVKSLGGRVLTIKYLKGYSTTGILKAASQNG